MQSLIYISRIIRISLLSHLALRSSYFMGLLREIIFLYLSIQLFKSFYLSSPNSMEIPLSETITYLVISKVAQFFNMTTMERIQSRILNGEIATDLLRPIHFDFFMLIQEFGSWIQRIITITTPLIIIAIIFVRLTPPNIANLFFFIISVLLSFIIMFFANYIVSLAAFWIPYLWSLNNVSATLFILLSGAMIPLWFYPDQIREVLEWLPFSLAVYTPIKIYLGHVSTEQVIIIYMQQLGWIFCLWIISRIVWSRAVKKITIYGG